MLDLKLASSKKRIRSLAVLTSGGDAPGMNAAIRSVVRYGISRGCQVYGVQKGYNGLFENQMSQLQLSSVANIIQRGGTILKTSRSEEFLKKSGRARCGENLERRGIEALVVIGGDGSFRGAHFFQKETGIPVMGIPGTIDNDIIGTDDTIGYDTAVNTAIEAIDRIRDTASSHDRLFLVEVMGRSSGEIALMTGIGGGAETILVPEHQESIPSVIKTIERGVRRGKTSSIIVVAEGHEAGRTGKIAKLLQKKGYRPKICTLGHIQRGGSPTARDRLLASAFGAAAVAYLCAGKSDSMVGTQENKMGLAPLSQVIHHTKPLDQSGFDLARVLAT
jgi:6-phosphofructokinase 1